MKLAENISIDLDTYDVLNNLPVWTFSELRDIVSSLMKRLLNTILKL